MSAMASQIAGVSIVCSTVGLGSDQRKHKISTPLDIVRGITPLTGGFLSQKASNTENASSWWRHRVVPFPSVPQTWIPVAYYAMEISTSLATLPSEQ